MKIICFSLVLSEEDVEKGKASFYALNKEAPSLHLIAITKSMLASRVGNVLERVLDDLELSSVDHQQNPDDELLPDSYKYRVVIVLTAEREQVFQVMRSFKTVLPDPQNIIFAVITETALTWTFGEYIDHLGKEHESMKSRK